MDRDTIQVSDDNILLQQILERHGFCAKQLASWTGRAASTIYKYLSGELTIPSIIWRAIFERTFDTQIFRLFAGEMVCIFAPLDKLTLQPDAASLKRLLDMRRKQINCEEYILQILIDGKVDASDTTAIANFKLAFPDMISAQAQIYQAILHEHSKTEAAKNA